MRGRAVKAVAAILTLVMLMSGSTAAAGHGARSLEAASCNVEESVAVSHVRPQDVAISAALQAGLRRSALLRDLVRRVESLPGLVYLRSGDMYSPRLASHGLRGATSHYVTAAGDLRVIRVIVEAHANDRTIATIGHELQHVVEILNAPGASDLASVENLFSRIGFPVHAGIYETVAAQAAGNRVYEELSRCSTR
jgi:hypothetical protein